MKSRIKLFIVTCVVFLTTMSANAFSFRNITLDFVHITDTHICQNDNTSYKALASSQALLEDAINQINAIKGLDFVLFTGDMVNSGTAYNYDLFYSALNKLKYPSLNAFGNHDFYGSESKDEVVKIVSSYNPNYTFSGTYWAISPKTDYRIIVLDSTIPNDKTANGELSREQLAFLDSELSQNQDKIVVIAMHHPSVEPFVAKEHALYNANEFNEILIKYKNPIVVLSGHYHAAKIRRIGNIVFVSTPAMVTYPMGFRHIKIVNFKDRVEYKFDFISTSLDEVKEQNRQNVISYSALAGLESDRTLEYTYYKRKHKSVSYKRNKIKNAAKDVKTSKRELKKLEKEISKPAQSEKVKKERKLFKKKEPKVKKERKGLFSKKNKNESQDEATVQ